MNDDSNPSASLPKLHKNSHRSASCKASLGVLQSLRASFLLRFCDWGYGYRSTHSNPQSIKQQNSGQNDQIPQQTSHDQPGGPNLRHGIENLWPIYVVLPSLLGKVIIVILVWPGGFQWFKFFVSCDLFFSCSISLYVCALLRSLLALPTKARILCVDWL